MSAMNVLEGINMNEERYVGLLTKVSGEKFCKGSIDVLTIEAIHV
jgi:hypothetical protein